MHACLSTQDDANRLLAVPQLTEALALHGDFPSVERQQCETHLQVARALETAGGTLDEVKLREALELAHAAGLGNHPVVKEIQERLDQLVLT